MPSSKRALGRGLDSILPPGVPAATSPGVRQVPVASIVPNPRQPRNKMDPQILKDLASSIKEHGLIQPLIVTPVPNFAQTKSDDTAPRYQLIAGERRWRAAKLAGLENVPVIVRGATPQEMLELALVENIQRADLNPLEEANAYRQLMDDFGMTQEQVAAKVGKDRATVANALRLLKLPAEIQAALAEETISEGHARALLTVTDSQQQKALLRAVVEHGDSVRQIEEAARRVNERRLTADRGRRSAVGGLRSAQHDMPAATRALEDDFRKALGTKVQVFRSRKGGKIVIHFYSEEELEAVYDKVVGKG